MEGVDFTKPNFDKTLINSKTGMHAVTNMDVTDDYYVNWAAAKIM